MHADIQRQCQRLLLGAVTEALIDAQLDVDLHGLRAFFGPDCVFRFLWFDNRLRFVGGADIPLRSAPSPESVSQFRERVLSVWPDLIGAFDHIPLGDHLDVTRAEAQVDVHDVDGKPVLALRFDLDAD